MKRLILALLFLATPALADKLADAQYILRHPEKNYAVGQIAWAKAFIAANAAPSPVATANVSSSAGLITALAKAKGGETIKLAPGNYSLQIVGVNPATPVTIDGSAGAIITAGSSCSNSSNLTFYKVGLKGSTAMPNGAYGFKWANCSKIDWTDSELWNDDRSGTAFIAKSSINRGFRILRDKIHGWCDGLSLFGWQDTLVDSSEFYGMGADSLKISNSVNAVVTHNWFHDAASLPTTHPDPMQWQGTNKNFVFSFNTIKAAGQGTGDYGQGPNTGTIEGNSFTMSIYQNAILHSNTDGVAKNNVAISGPIHPALFRFGRMKHFGNRIDGKAVD